MSFPTECILVRRLTDAKAESRQRQLGCFGAPRVERRIVELDRIDRHRHAIRILGFAANGEQKAADHGLGRVAARDAHRRLGRPRVEDRVVHFERGQRDGRIGGREAAKDVDLAVEQERPAIAARHLAIRDDAGLKHLGGRIEIQHDRGIVGRAVERIEAARAVDLRGQRPARKVRASRHAVLRGQLRPLLRPDRVHILPKGSKEDLDVEKKHVKIAKSTHLICRAKLFCSKLNLNKIDDIQFPR